MKDFEDFLAELTEEITTYWLADDGGLTMAASDEMCDIAFWRTHVSESQESLIDRLDDDFTRWSWVDDQVHTFLTD